MPGLFDGTPLQRPVTCEVCEKPLPECRCPRDASGKVLLPTEQTALVRLEKRPGGKLVTLIDGLDPTASNLDALLKHLRTHCAAGGTVQNGVVQLQGDHRENVAQALRGLGYRIKIR